MGVTFNGDIDKLTEFIDQFKSYLESIETENDNINTLMSAFSQSISMTGSYDDAIEGQRSSFLSQVSALKENVQATLAELIKLKENAEAAAATMNSFNPETKNIDRTI